MKKEIENRIIELGGTCNFQNSSLQENLESISFNKAFLTQEFEDLLDDEQCEEIRVKGAIPESEIQTYLIIEVEPFLFTPFKEGTDDYDEWYDGCLDDYEDYVKSVVGTDELDFMVIGYTDAERYLVCLSDKNVENPTVYSIDMDIPFAENGGLSIEGTLEDYFNNFVSAEEYQIKIEKLVEELREG